MTLCHTGTKDLADHTRRADIVVAAAGVAGLITADMVKPGAAVLDVGMSRTDGGIWSATWLPTRPRSRAGWRRCQAVSGR